MLCELGVQVFCLPVLEFLQLCLLGGISELFPDEIQLLLIEDVNVLIHIVKPRMVE